MEQVIWVEILSRHRDVASRLRFVGGELRIGRGYDNDVVLDDPYVAARHARVLRDDDGQLIAEDLGSANGMFLDRGTDRQRRIVIDGDKPIRIGHTFVRIRDAGFVVPAERSTGRPARRVLTVALAVTLALAILGIEALSVWVTETVEPRMSHYLLPLLIVSAAVVIWVAVWSLLTRILAGNARFGHNLLIALAGVLAFSLYNELGQFSAFALTWPILVDYQFVATWCVLAVVCFLHLREIGPSRLMIKAGAIAALFGCAIALQATLRQSEAFADSNRQTSFRRLMPPMLRLVPAHDEARFFVEIEELKAKLDRDRTRARAEDGEQ